MSTSYPAPTLPPYPYTWRTGEWGTCSGGTCGSRVREVWCEVSCSGPWCPFEEDESRCAQYVTKPEEEEACTGTCTSTTLTTSTSSSVTVTQGPTETTHTTTISTSTLGTTTVLQIATSTTRSIGAGTSGSTDGGETDSDSLFWTLLLVLSGLIVFLVLACMAWGFWNAYAYPPGPKESPSPTAAAAATGATAEPPAGPHHGKRHAVPEAWADLEGGGAQRWDQPQPGAAFFERPVEMDAEPPGPSRSESPPDFASNRRESGAGAGAAGAGAGAAAAAAASGKRRRNPPQGAAQEPAEPEQQEPEPPGFVPRPDRHSPSPGPSPGGKSQRRNNARRPEERRQTAPGPGQKQHAGFPSSPGTEKKAPPPAAGAARQQQQQRASAPRQRPGRASDRPHDWRGPQGAGGAAGARAAEAPPAPVAAAAEAGGGLTTVDIITKLDVELDSTRGRDLEWRRKNFKGLMLRWHPDKNPDAAEQAAEVTKHLLSRRAAYLES